MSQMIYIRDIWKKYDIWISIIIFVMLILALVAFAVVPLQKNMQANLDEMQRKLIDGDISKSRISKIPEMKKIEATLEANKDSLQVILNNDDEVDFIKRIEALADETGNKIDIKVNDDQQAQKANAAKKNTEGIKSSLPYTKYLSLQINLEGTYEKMLNFVHKIENMAYYVNIISFEAAKIKGETIIPSNSLPVSPDKQEKAPDIVRSQLEVVVYLEN